MASTLVNWSEYISNSYEEYMKTTSDFDFCGKTKQQEQTDENQALVLIKLLGLGDLQTLKEEAELTLLEGEEDFAEEMENFDNISKVSNLSLNRKHGMKNKMEGGLTVPSNFKKF